MSNTALPTPREIARLIPQCPLCEGDSYLAIFENSDAGFVLNGLHCDTCEEDILSHFLRIPPAIRKFQPEAPKPLGTSLRLVCIGTVAMIGWLMLTDFG